MRLPSEFVANVRREAEERGVSLGRVITDRCKWVPGPVKDAPRETAPVPQAAPSAAPAGCEHVFRMGVSGLVACAKCGQRKGVG